MYERIHCERFEDKGCISIEVTETQSIVVAKEQAQQLVIDLQQLLMGQPVDDEPIFPNVTNDEVIAG